MKKSKLITLLSSFSSREMERFDEFVRSPYYNSNEQLARLSTFLSALHPCFPEEKVTAKAVYQAVFPGEPPDKKKLSYLMTGLVKLGERFLGVQRLEKQDTLLECQVMKELVERKQEKHFIQYFKQAQSGLGSQHSKNSDTYYHQYLLTEVAQYLPGRQGGTADNSLQAASDALDRYYFINKLKYSCEMVNRQAIVSEQFSIPFMEEVCGYLERFQPLPPLINIYLQIYYSLLNPSEGQHLRTLLGLIRENAASIETSELKNIYLYAINICMRKIRQGEGEYLSIGLGLYEDGIRNKSLLDNNYLSHWTYNNIVKLALRLERFEWIEKFIYNYNGVLQEEFRENAFHYYLAELYFYKRNYDEALIHLHQVQASDLKYHLVARILLIKAFYESNALESCMSALAAFTVYLSRNKQIAVPLKKSCQNFCALLHSIMSQPSQKKKERLREQIRIRQPLADRAWLMSTFEKQHKR